MLSSLQGGRKANPLAVRKEAHFNKALLSSEKGKQAEKHVPPLHGCVYMGFLLGKKSLISVKNIQKKKHY